MKPAPNLPLDATRPQVKLGFRLAFYLLVALGLSLGWWNIPWPVFLVVAGLALPLYGLALWRLPYWSLLALDALVFVPLLGFSGGAASPFVFLPYLWFFGVVLLNPRYTRAAPLALVCAAMLASLLAGAWGSAGGWGQAGGWGFVSLHALGTAVAALVGLSLLRERVQQEIDPLSGVLHRRAGIERLNEWIERDQAFSLAFVDFKHFKRVNDNYGHAVGDEVLAAVAGRLAGRVRRGDIVMRYGGDEFVLASDLLALRPRLEAAMLPPVMTSAGAIRVEADIGEVKWVPGESLEDLLVAADEAMYRKKHGGSTRREEAGPAPGADIAGQSLPDAPA